MKNFDEQEAAILRSMRLLGGIVGREDFKPELRDAFDRLVAGKYILASWSVAPDVGEFLDRNHA